MARIDTIVENALVVDGTGQAGYAADVAIGGGRIVDVGVLKDWPAEQRIDGSGCVICPGFIDVHTHDDVALIDTPGMDFKVSQGVTTVIAGNCGVSVAPLSNSTNLPPPYPLLGPVDVFRYPTVASYRNRIEYKPPAVNVALLVGHSGLRIETMHGGVNAPATSEETTAMAEQLDAAMRQGAIGLSSGLDYPPAEMAGIDEVVTLAKVVSQFEGGVYTTHMRNEGDSVVEAIEETLETGRRSGARVVISHHKCAGPKNYGRSVETLKLIEDAQLTQDVTLDVYPYTASSTSLLKKFVEDAESVLVTWSEAHPESGGRMLADIAADWDCDIMQAVERLDPAGAIYFQMDEDDLRRILAFPSTMIGSDGLPGREKPHPRLWGTFPRVLARYVREQAVLSLPRAIHKMTGLSAETFGLRDRGYIYPGWAADLVLFDPNTIADTATFDAPESPARGIRCVIVNGEIAWSDGAGTGSRSGRFLSER